jgi:hypothetical protein
MGAALLAAFGCSGRGSSDDGQPRAEGQSDFTSSSPGSGSRAPGVGVADGANAGGESAPTTSDKGESATPRTVEETDLYRVEGDRLYYLNAYRGLMVFDVSNVDAPRFLGRSPIYGTPEQMIVRNGVATVVVSDWYGKMDDGTPFHGSIVRGIDASNPSQMKVLGEAELGGSVRDTRVVGDVIYAVTQEYPYYYYGWNSGATGSAANTARVTVASVSFAGGVIQKKDEYAAAGQDGVFFVNSDSILLGHQVYGTPDKNGYSIPTNTAQLDYIDISDPQGTIRTRGRVTFDGTISGWSTDNGRWNIDFADKKTAHALACAQTYCGNGQGLVLATADFSNPDQPELASVVSLPGNSWSPAVRFDAGRMYLSPSGQNYYGVDDSGQRATPIQIFDLSNPAAPALKGTVNVTGQVWNFTPSGNRLFALGGTYTSTVDSYGSKVDLHYLDVTNPAAPVTLGTASFGQGWAWTPAAGTFKAFAKDDAQGLVVLPFSGYDYRGYTYNNGLQLIEFTENTLSTSGAARTRGWVERGIFVKNRLISLSDVSLAVVDYTSHEKPEVVSEVTLSRNVVNVKPQAGGKLAELSSDFWDNDTSSSVLRVLDTANVSETSKDATLASLDLPGINARVFHNGNFSYVLSQVNRRGPCKDDSGNDKPDPQQCNYWHTRVQVVDRSGATPRLRGAADLPETQSYWWWGWGWGYWGCGVADWYYGEQTVQVGGDLLAFQSYEPPVSGSTDWTQNLVTVNLADPDQPVIGKTAVVDRPNWWWGNLRAVGDRLYASHYEWVSEGHNDLATNTWVPGTVRYYLDRFDLSDPAHPVVASRVNVPGILVGASESNPNLIYTIDYRWYGNSGANELAVSLLDGEKAYFQGSVQIPGYVGNVFVRGSSAYFSAEQQTYDSATGVYSFSRNLFRADLSNPRSPELFSSTPSEGWGWMLDVQGDRAFVQSGWGEGLDVYKLNATGAPTFEQTVRSRGWYTGALAREGNDVYLATGYWGTEHITLK